MRGKLPTGRGWPAKHAAGGLGDMVAAVDRKEVRVSPARRSATSILGLLAAVLVAVTAARSQGNIDAGKTPAQMFSDTCSTCHRRPQELKRGASASFLRQHYMSGPQEAAAMAAYLAGIPNDPRARGKDKQDKARQQQAQDKSKGPQAKGRRAAELSKAPEPPPDPPPESKPAAEPPPVAKLEPFEE